MSNDDESTVWKGGPSQVVNLPVFLACLLMAIACLVVGANLEWFISLGALGALVAGAIAGWNWLVVRCRKYEITTQRLRLFEGVLNQDIDEVELYRVKDTRI
ncbi:MAG: PH domain-containing protein, partial [Roseibacillus sp.]